MCVCMKLAWNIAFLTMEHQESENYMWWCKDTCVHEWQVTQSNKIILRSTLLTFKKGNWCETVLCRRGINCRTQGKRDWTNKRNM
jgi:hypothetical protein